MNCKNFIKIVFFLIGCLNFVFCYKNITIQNYNLCPNPKKIFTKVITLIKGKDIYLGERKESAIIIRQTWDANTLNYLDPNCKFVVYTKDRAPGSGLYSAISKLNFRKENDTCIDYIMVSGQNKSFCDKVDILKNDNEHPIVNEHEHKVEIQIKINKKIKIEEPLEMVIIVTQHMNCNLLSNKHQCDPNNSFSCIWSDFVNDGIPNCIKPYLDESGKDLQKSIISEPLVPAISALTSMIFTMITVGGCVWGCWKYWECLKIHRIHRAESQDSNREHNSRAHAVVVQNNIEMSLTSGDIGILTHTLPKDDLPPSYESLFPEDNLR